LCNQSLICPDLTQPLIGTLLTIPPFGSVSTGTGSTSGGNGSSGGSQVARVSGTGTAGSTRYTVRAGDTLSSIAQQVYGDGRQWQLICDANQSVIGPDRTRLPAGTVPTVTPLGLELVPPKVGQETTFIPMAGRRQSRFQWAST
jgi:hypothetical protein